MTFSESKQFNETQYGDLNRGPAGFGDKFLYLLVGCGLGAATALLFAPKAGVELRSDIADITKKGYDETLDLAHQLKEQSADFYQAIKEKTDTVYGLAAEKFARGQEFMDTASNMAGDLISGDTNRREGLKSSTTGRRPTNIV